MKSITTLLIIFLSCLTGCDSFVDVDTPDSQLTGNSVFEDRNTANAAMADIYSKLRDSGVLSGQTLGTSYTLGLYADELTYYSSATNPEFTNTMLGSSPVSASVWNESYKQIYGANAIIEGVHNAVSLAVNDRNQFKGEALFVRALVHFYLTNMYGDIPYVTTTDYNVNRLVSRMPVEEVYQHIISDLNEAIDLLPEEYISAERVRANRATAHALLARVYLYHGNWAEASNEASAVINNPLYNWETDLDNIFLKSSTTTIWQFMPKLEGNNTDEGSLFIFLTGPPPLIALTTDFVTSFEAGDQRKEHWIATVTSGTETWFHSYKYKQNSNTGSSLEYSVVFRLAEQYLIRAEARAMQGELSIAKEDLNKIRHLAGLGDTDAATATEIAVAVLNERRHELFTEYGHRFFDLKRTNNLDSVLSLSKIGWDHNDMFWPIPNNELLANPNLHPQNPGY